MQKSFFTSDRVFLFAVSPVTLFAGASDIDQFHGPETGGQAQELNPGPTKRACCEVSGSTPGPTKHHVHGDDQKYVERAHNIHME